MTKTHMQNLLAQRYLEKVAEAIDALTGKPGEWAESRRKERAAVSVLTAAGGLFAPLNPVCGLGHKINYLPSGEYVLSAGFVLHHRADILDGTGIRPEDVVDDGVPQVTVPCVGILADKRVVHFYAFLSLAQAIGITPPDDGVLAHAAAEAGRGRNNLGMSSLEWWAK